MITATPTGKTITIAVDAGATTYIGAANPMFNSSFVAQIPESTTKQSFTITDLLDGTVADEYLNYDGAHNVISVKTVNGVAQYEGCVITPTGDDSQRFVVLQFLTQAEIVALRTERNGPTVYSYRLRDIANVSKAEELRIAQAKALIEATIWV